MRQAPRQWPSPDDRVRPPCRSKSQAAKRWPERRWREGRCAQRSDRSWSRAATLSGIGSQGYANGVDDLPQNGFGRLRFFLQRSVARAGDHAVRENGDGQMFEVVRQTIIATIEKSAG